MAKKIDYKAKLKKLEEASNKAVKNLEKTGEEFSEVMKEVKQNWGGTSNNSSIRSQFSHGHHQIKKKR